MKARADRQSNTEYILASGASKLVAIALTYPYQVVRARVQNAVPALTPSLSSAVPSPTAQQASLTPSSSPSSTALPKASPTISIPAISRAIWRNEGARGFYKGLGTNALRILPGTCTTFVVYENLVWGFRALALRRDAKAGKGPEGELR